MCNPELEHIRHVCKCDECEGCGADCSEDCNGLPPSLHGLHEGMMDELVNTGRAICVRS